MRQLLHTLYVTEPDVSLRLTGETLNAVHADGRKDSIPLHMLENILCFSYISATPPLMEACAKAGIGLSFFSQNGTFRYRIVGDVRGNVLLRKRQYALSEDSSARMSPAKQMLCGKLENERQVLLRFSRNHPESKAEMILAAAKLKEDAGKLCDASTEEQLRGIEGTSARVYFNQFDKLILQEDSAMRFHCRNRRPPKDPVNALLSFAYTILTSDCTNALTSVGLDPYVGFLHRDRPGKPSLALDLMEELRPLVADRFVLRLINLKIITSKMFEKTDSNGMILDPIGKKLFLREWSKERTQEVYVPELSEKIQKGLLPHIQAQFLAQYIRGDILEYHPMQVR